MFTFLAIDFAVMFLMLSLMFGFGTMLYILFYGLFILFLVFVGLCVAFVVGVGLYTTYRIISGKMPKEEYERNLREWPKIKQEWRERRAKLKAFRKKIISLDDGVNPYSFYE